MDRNQIDDALKQINTPGSDLHKRYVNWRKLSMTGLVGEILQHLAHVDNTVRGVPTIDPNQACATLGYVSGRSHSATDMVCLDQLQPAEPATIEDEYNTTEEGEQ